MTFDYNDIDTLIGKDLAGEISAEEKTILTRWTESSDDNKSYYEHFKTLFDKSLDLKHTEIFDTDVAWEKLKAKVKNQNQSKKTIHFTWRIAASIALLITVGFFIYQKFLTPQQKTTLLANTNPVENILPDGTEVFMNKNTTVEYVYDRVKKIRKTKLKGEAYFNIAEKENQQFLLEVNSLLIQDIGTAFNVKAYPDSDTVEIYVESGEVIFYTSLDSGLHLSANETGYYHVTSGRFSKVIASNENMLAYKTQIFVFDNTRVDEIVDLINEVYDVKLKLEKKEIGNCRITATFKHETIDIIAEILATVLNLTLEKTKDEITLKGNGCAK